MGNDVLRDLEVDTNFCDNIIKITNKVSSFRLKSV